MNTFLLASWIACQSLDLGSTYVALHSGQFVERNTLYAKSAQKTAVLKVSVNVGAMFLHQAGLRHQDRRFSRIILPLVGSSSGCIVGGWNLAQLTKHGH